MSKYLIENTTLTAIADAVREKSGTTDLIKVSELPTAIAAIQTGGGGGGIPEEALILTGDCSSKFANNQWNWFIEEYGNQITTNNITNASSMFSGSSELVEVPFDINISVADAVLSMFLGCSKLEKIGNIIDSSDSVTRANSMFSGCEKLKEVGKISGLRIYGASSWFDGCKSLKELPVLENCSGEWATQYNATTKVFCGCMSLRTIPNSYLSLFKDGKWTGSSYHFYNQAFSGCWALDEINNIPINETVTLTSNVFSNTFVSCRRVKDITFETNNNNPLTAKWKNQTITLTNEIGHGLTLYAVNNQVNGLSADKQITEDTYQVLKDDPDAWAQDSLFSRYNHDSAVNTINSLPDTSAYLATAGGTNTIKFYGVSGTNTDGGAINTLTEEEIAVAAAKGWTVTLA